ncbi:MAG TPA: acyl-CoA dehydrogenase family protein [Solirubrobacteraceae bacterium]|nr:acyl-CoA dehydrogenase family protein [Solirubrobacteraceae bacterium]
MDLELSDEQVWLEESINTLLERRWLAAESAWQAGEAERARLWESLVEFGLLGGAGNDLGAIELCLVARAVGGHLAVVPLIGSVAVRYALAPFAAELPDDFRALQTSDARLAIGLLEPGGGWSPSGVRATVKDSRLTGTKAAVEHAAVVDYLVVVALVGAEPGLALVRRDSPGVEWGDQPALDGAVPLSRVTFGDANTDAVLSGQLAQTIIDRLISVGGLLAAAEAVGASANIFSQAQSYATERRQFGRTIGSNQALRHLMADLHVRQASSWSTTLYAAAALDEGIPGARLTGSVAKAYVSRSAREVAHGSIQVFGGIAFTEEHPAHRFLRRIILREQQFGDAAHHERELGRTLAATANASASASGINERVAA